MRAADPALTSLLTAVPRLLAEPGRDLDSVRPLALSGLPSAATALRLALIEDGDPGLAGTVAPLDLERPEVGLGAALVYVIRARPSPLDERALRQAERIGVPLLCLLLEPARDVDVLPYVRATDVVAASAIDQEALDRLGTRLAARAPGHAFALAQGLPAIRAGVARGLVRQAARHNAIVATRGEGGPQLPRLAAEQIRLALRLAGGSGRSPLLALGCAAAAGLVGRALVRRLRPAPVPGWLLQAVVAYAGTRAVGRATTPRSAP